jgi:hypothetical protein
MQLGLSWSAAGLRPTELWRWQYKAGGGLNLYKTGEGAPAQSHLGYAVPDCWNISHLK